MEVLGKHLLLHKWPITTDAIQCCTGLFWAPRYQRKGRIISPSGWGSLGELHRAVTSDQTPSVSFL